ncbi:hydroxyethylthiazole kinase [Natronomonas amylolytica]|uniref:hydroxyethylthiazole kinase n=1 Tax=Natronomonas amylolytica TaxID=3108498 RepID=UPI003009119B
MTEPSVDPSAALAAVEQAGPLVNSVTNSVTVNDVANVTLHWGGLPVMSDDEREVGEMVSTAGACLLNMGTVDEAGEGAMLTAGAAANESGIPLVVDPVGVGATSVRTAVAERLVTDLDVTVLKGNYAEITALVGEDADVRGVESVGEYSDIAETAVTCAREHDTVVVASGETDVVATDEAAYEVSVGHPLMGQVVGTGCMLGVTLATFGGGLGVDRPLETALAGTACFGLAGERAAEEGEYNGPASYKTAFLDTVANMGAANAPVADERIEQVLSAE